MSRERKIRTNILSARGRCFKWSFCFRMHFWTCLCVVNPVQRFWWNSPKDSVWKYTEEGGFIFSGWTRFSSTSRISKCGPCDRDVSPVYTSAPPFLNYNIWKYLFIHLIIILIIFSLLFNDYWTSFLLKLPLIFMTTSKRSYNSSVT